MYAYTQMVTDMGMPRERVLYLENGDHLLVNSHEAKFLEPVESSGSVLVDGISEGGVSEFIIRDRKHLGSDGTVIVTVVMDRATGDILSGPDLISRGFLHPEDSEEIFEETRSRVGETLSNLDQEEEFDWDNVSGIIRDVTSRYLKKVTGRRPVVIPVVMEI